MFSARQLKGNEKSATDPIFKMSVCKVKSKKLALKLHNKKKAV